MKSTEKNPPLGGHCRDRIPYGSRAKAQQAHSGQEGRAYFCWQHKTWHWTHLPANAPAY